LATYGGAVDLVLTELARTDTSITVVVEREILKAIEFYAPTRFWFNEARSSFTASNTILYPLSTVAPNLLEIDQVLTTVSGSVVELEQKTQMELNRRDISGFTGPPSYFSSSRRSSGCIPSPQAARPTRSTLKVLQGSQPSLHRRIATPGRCRA
jgi:hypothetical protein